MDTKEIRKRMILCLVGIILLFMIKMSLDKGFESSDKKIAYTEAVTSVPESDISESTSVQTVSETTAETSEPVTSKNICDKTESEKITIKYTDAVLDYAENNIYSMNLDEISTDGELIDSFVFTIHSGDSTTPLGELKFGFGISVSDECPGKTNKKWYSESDVCSIDTEGSTCSVMWIVPENIREYIDVTNGKMHFGYWWGQADEIVVDEIICRKTVQNEDE